MSKSMRSVMSKSQVSHNTNTESWDETCAHEKHNMREFMKNSDFFKARECCFYDASPQALKPFKPLSLFYIVSDSGKNVTVQVFRSEVWRLRARDIPVKLTYALLDSFYSLENEDSHCKLNIETIQVLDENRLNQEGMNVLLSYFENKALSMDCNTIEVERVDYKLTRWSDSVTPKDFLRQRGYSERGGAKSHTDGEKKYEKCDFKYDMGFESISDAPESVIEK